MPVYFIRAGETPYVKIGFTTGIPRNRLWTVQANNHEKLHLVRILDDADARDEMTLHRFFEAHRHRGEWFSLTDEQVNQDFGDIAALVPPLEIEAIKEEVLRFLDESGMAGSAFGKLAANDAEVVDKLCGKRLYCSFTPLKAGRIRAFLDARKQQVAA